MSPHSSPSPQNAKSVAIIGAGPAGLMAAEIVASGGHRVDIYEAMPSPARKFLMAGRGGLNLTHSEPLERFLNRYIDPAGAVLADIEAFPPAALEAWANGLGVETFIGSSGRVFPKAMKASPLLRAWLRRLDHLGVALHTRMRWTGWNNDGGLIFQCDKPDGAFETTIRADAVVLAMGGASWPRLGSDGAWKGVLAQEGITVSPLRPFNCGVAIEWSKPLSEKFNGAPIKRIAVTCGQTRARGEAVITRTGLEGGAIYAINSAVMRDLDKGKPALIEIDLRPDLSLDQLTQRLAGSRGRQSLSTFLRKAAALSPPAIAIAREPEAGSLPENPLALAKLIKAVPLSVHAMGGIETAISTAGGIDAGERDANAMLIKKPGTFVAGEMLDWAAPTGGYLLQATFASAVRAANGALKWLQPDASDAHTP